MTLHPQRLVSRLADTDGSRLNHLHVAGGVKLNLAAARTPDGPRSDAPVILHPRSVRDPIDRHLPVVIPGEIRDLLALKLRDSAAVFLGQKTNQIDVLRQSHFFDRLHRGENHDQFFVTTRILFNHCQH